MIGEALRLLRTLHDVKLTEFAEELGVSPSFISEIENDKKRPNLEIIEKYAKKFDLRPSAILFFAEELDTKTTKGKIKGFARDKMMRLLHIVENSRIYSDEAQTSKSSK